MKKNVMAVVGALCAVSLVMFVTGCGKKKSGPMEDLGKSADSAVSSAADEAKAAGDEAGKAADEAKEKADEAVE